MTLRLVPNSPRQGLPSPGPQPHPASHSFLPHSDSCHYPSPSGLGKGQGDMLYWAWGAQPQTWLADHSVSAEQVGGGASLTLILMLSISWPPCGRGGQPRAKESLADFRAPSTRARHDGGWRQKGNSGAGGLHRGYSLRAAGPLRSPLPQGVSPSLREHTLSNNRKKKNHTLTGHSLLHRAQELGCQLCPGTNHRAS